MKVLVTGAAGFIGSYVVQALLDQQVSVIAVDNLSTGKLSNLSKKALFYEMDITKNELETVFQIEQPDYVIHLAAQSSVIESMNNPIEDCQANLFGTLNILRYVRQYEVKKCVIASSAAVYGNPTILPVSEDSKLSPLSFYALSKLSAEKYAQLYEKLFDVKSSVLRFSNVFGPKQPNGVITSLIHKLIEGENPVIYDGNQTRDFIYVKDVAAACVQAIKPEHTGVYNISSGKEISIQSVYEKIAELVGRKSEPIYESLREGEIKRSVLSNENAITKFGWTPSYSFIEGLKETILYYTPQNQPN